MIRYGQQRVERDELDLAVVASPIITDTRSTAYIICAHTHIVSSLESHRSFFLFFCSVSNRSEVLGLTYLICVRTKCYITRVFFAYVPSLHINFCCNICEYSRNRDSPKVFGVPVNSLKLPKKDVLHYSVLDTPFVWHHSRPIDSVTHKTHTP